MFRRILVAYDGAEHSARALSEAADLARASDGELTVLTVVPQLAKGIETARVPPPNLGELQKAIEDRWRREEQEAVRALPDDLRVTSKLRIGHAGTEIVAQARAGGNDLVVVGSHGRGEGDPRLPGSVSQHVVHASPVPVLIVDCNAHSSQLAQAASPTEAESVISPDGTSSGQP